jgi:hypothetical protein
MIIVVFSPNTTDKSPDKSPDLIIAKKQKKRNYFRRWGI